MNKLLIADWLSGGGAEGLLVGDLANLSSCEPSWNYQSKRVARMARRARHQLFLTEDGRL